MLDKYPIMYILNDMVSADNNQVSQKGDFMFEVTEKAGEVIKRLIEGKDPQSVRIMMTEGG